MPAKKTYVYVEPKGTTTRKPRRLPKADPIPRGLSGFAREQIRTLCYTDSFTLSNTAGVLTEYQFRANSLYDPNFSGTGHQPFGFDQIAAFYNHYDVLSSTIKVSMIAPNAGYTTAVVTGVYLSDDSSAYADWHTYSEAKRGTNKIVAPFYAGATVTKSSFDKKKFFSKSADPGETTALVTASPAEEVLFHIWQQPVDQSSNSNPYQYTVEMTFKVRFFEPKDIVAS